MKRLIIVAAVLATIAIGSTAVGLSEDLEPNEAIFRTWLDESGYEGAIHVACSDPLMDLIVCYTVVQSETTETGLEALGFSTTLVNGVPTNFHSVEDRLDLATLPPD